MLRQYQDISVHLEIDPSVPPAVHPPRKIPIALLETAQQKLKEMEEDGIMFKVEEHLGCHLR